MWIIQGASYCAPFFLNRPVDCRNGVRCHNISRRAVPHRRNPVLKSVLCWAEGVNQPVTRAPVSFIKNLAYM